MNQNGTQKAPANRDLCRASTYSNIRCHKHDPHSQLYHILSRAHDISFYLHGLVLRNLKKCLTRWDEKPWLAWLLQHSGAVCNQSRAHFLKLCNELPWTVKNIPVASHALTSYVSWSLNQFLLKSDNMTFFISVLLDPFHAMFNLHCSLVLIWPLLSRSLAVLQF